MLVLLGQEVGIFTGVYLGACAAEEKVKLIEGRADVSKLCLTVQV
jgi:hypothetical protein